MKKRNIILAVIMMLAVLLTVTAVVVAGVSIFNNTTRDYREKIIENSSKLAAEQVDGDKIDEWLENGEDQDYKEYYGDNDSTLEGVEHLKDRLNNYGIASYEVKIYNSHHYQYVPEMLLEYISD